MKTVTIVIALCLSLATGAQRIIASINQDWQFAKDDGAGQLSFVPVNLPHTWNVDDVMDDEPGYYRGPAIYKRMLFVDRQHEGKTLYLHFEGANQVTRVFINGKEAGAHTGGYSAFYVPVSSYVQYGAQNEVEVRVDNSHNPDIPPLSADFTFYGGIYRDAWLITTDPVHFSFKDNHTGVLITTPVVNAKEGTVQVKTAVQHEGSVKTRLRLHCRIIDDKGKAVTQTSKDITAAAGSQSQIEFPLMRVRNPKLWSPDSPVRYRVIIEIKDRDSGRMLDRISHPIGFRWFQFDAGKGFFLNGKPLKLVGTSRHQDYPGMGNAVPDSLAIRDVVLLKQMGGNFLRVAHYPQDPVVLSACDSLGILASVEIPVVNEITESKAFRENALQMQQEMIRQHFNHPSVIIWCYMNEALLRMPFNGDRQRQDQYLQSVRSLAFSLDSLTRALDPGRYTMMAHHASYTNYKRAGLLEIPMIVGWNLYSGWYGGRLNDFPAFLDSFHAWYPGKPLVVSEYGADADPRIRSLEPVRFDKSVDYSLRFHQFYWMAMNSRPFVAAAMIWNLADFHSETRTETMPHINNKGLLKWDRTPKDLYYYYQSVLSKRPAARLMGTDPVSGIPGRDGVYNPETIVAATNMYALELWVNGKSAGEAGGEDGLCEWKVQLQDGWNHLRVRGPGRDSVVSDTASILYRRVNISRESFEKGRSLKVLLGARRFYTGSDGGIWVPDQPYRPGSWGHVGGRPFKTPGNDRLPYGTDKNILNTDDDPVYQTQQTGIRNYKMDLAEGEYEITLYFAELMGVPATSLPYNLSESSGKSGAGNRVFHVYVNGKPLLENFDIASQYGRAVAVSKIFRHRVQEGEVTDIQFESVTGEPVLNAIQVRKIE